MTNSESGVGKIVIIVIVALVIVAAIAGFVMMQPKSATAPSPSPTPTQGMMVEDSPTSSPSGETMMPDTEGKIIIEGSNFKFAPNNITVKEGKPVTIVFKNAGGIHDFRIDELDVKTAQIQGGATEEVTFTPTKIGTFEFYCSVGNHRAMGMVGTLTVTE